MFFQKNQMKMSFLQVLAVLSLVLFFFTGCYEDGSDNDAVVPSITGYWLYDSGAGWGDGFEVSSDGSFKYYADTSKTVAFEGTIEAESSVLSNTDGTLVIHLAGDGQVVGFLNYTYMVDQYYTIVPWKSLGETQCQMSTAYMQNYDEEDSPDGEVTDTESLANKQDAITTITEAKGYFGYFGTYTRQ